LEKLCTFFSRCQKGPEGKVVSLYEGASWIDWKADAKDFSGDDEKYRLVKRKFESS